ncbi:hypothetical protein CYMTET_51694 [Cymbomonas tetramitiformis]|uniref:Uncharacterized protein n=1 Tax=Cymbomonas tetramitiformis TaxID=36881 RepID=A0AAE0ETF6_9CHLO|nr:hypothetical protein CYMTET_51694 [Cymbomonas tetramitiformis]
MTNDQRGVVSASVADNRPNMSKQFETLAKELKDTLAHEVDDIKSRVSRSSASARGMSDDEEAAKRSKPSSVPDSKAVFSSVRAFGVNSQSNFPSSYVRTRLSIVPELHVM